MQSATSSELTCPSCRQVHHLSDIARTEMYVCGNCHSVLHTGPGTLHTAYALNAPKGKPLLTPGTQGILKGRRYTVIAVTEKFETGAIPYYWFEYILLDDNHELAYLSFYEGHWNLLKPLTGTPAQTLRRQVSQPSVTWDGQTLKRFSRYQARYHYASGEFYWTDNLRKGTHCLEYICPPKLIAVEYDKGNPEDWDVFGGEYIYPREVSKAFFKGARMPVRKGIAPAQPFSIDLWRFFVGGIIFCFLIFLIQQFYSHRSQSLQVLKEYIVADTSNTGKPIISPSFKVSGKNSNLTTLLETDLDNSWCEAEVTLVNEQTGKETAFVLGAEYYNGISEGEAWNEGSRWQEEFICSVAPGSYHFVTIFSKETNGRPVSLTLTAWWDMPSWWNAGFIAMTMGIIALIIRAADYFFELRRWHSSNVDPYLYK
ncbi:DUF4178 domain-containing protein [Chitinophaga sp. Mgbs1]|uniref:DUF4178 domain-containing protein n=1 Tax=Chitinophaga solisilvae TaxID=1233460 RepID=A0A9Q5GR29_9BACT|nr:DUF4178 domain-containing protein [Chitinophaga solisilvae]